ncbi:transcription factor ORG2-like [Bidens hawaiensis]|uniref:transcription factor ORG2-like n=1 Tax=Bidens hawaiensis TaxID=980011 RepID=UPI004049ECB0
MLALSPPLFSTTYGWPVEDNLIANNLSYDCNEANSYSPLPDFHIHDQIKHTSVPGYSNSSGGAANSGSGDNMTVERKINHNASERVRRKKVNELSAFLRSLLPVSSDQKKKISIPGTVSRALKYIPELQKEVEILKRKKEKLSSSSTVTGNTRQDNQEQRGIKKQSEKVLVNIVGDKEVVIQLISSADPMNKKIHLLSKVLEYLEQDEDGLVLENATSFKGLGEGVLLSTLHLQVQVDHKIEAKKLNEKLHTFYQ